MLRLKFPIFWLKYAIEDAGIKKAGIFYLIFSQRMGINILGVGGLLWKSYQLWYRMATIYTVKQEIIVAIT